MLRLPQSAPWPVSVCAAFWQSGRCPPPPRSASSPARYSEWWRPLSAPRQHYRRTFSHRLPRSDHLSAVTVRLRSAVDRLVPAVNTDGPILAKLLLGFVHLTNEVDEALPRLGHALLWPISELELTHGPRLAILRETGNDTKACTISSHKRASFCRMDSCQAIAFFAL